MTSRENPGPASAHLLWVGPGVAAAGALGTAALSSAGAAGWLAAALSAGAGLVITGRQTRRVGDAVRWVHEVAAAVSRGDLTAGASGAGTADPLGLSAPVGATVAHLAGTIGAIAPVAKLLTIAGEELEIVGETIADGARGTSSQAETISASAAEVSENIQLAAAAGEQLRASIQEIARTTSGASQVAREAVSAVTSASATILKLGESSAKIGDIIAAITSIAEQTNLLALNATIEAARAGDAGKGFAVVASEVKDLAQETARATEEITSTIQRIQTDSASAVAAIGEVNRIIDEISQSQLTISSAVEEQAQTTQQVTRTTQDVSEQASRIAGAIETVVELSKSNYDAAERSRRAVKEIARMGGELQRETAGLRFAATGGEGGFEITWDRAANRLSDVCFGLWSDETCERYVRELSAAYRENTPGWTFLVDFSNHPAQSEKVQATHEAMMAAAVRSGLAWCGFVAQNPLVAMQMQRLSDRTGFPVTYVTSRSEALEAISRHGR